MASGSLPAGPAGRFPATRRSVVLASRDPDPEIRRQAFAVLAESYWKPVYKYLRMKWQTDAEDARDLTQSFFVLALEKGTFERYDPERARFRTYLRLCLDGYAVNEKRAASRIKRGGGAAPLSLDFEGAEEELARQGAADSIGMEEYFHREWVRALFSRAVEELRRRCEATGRRRRFLLFERYDVEGGDGADENRSTRISRPSMGSRRRAQGGPSMTWVRRCARPPARSRGVPGLCSLAREVHGAPCRAGRAGASSLLALSDYGTRLPLLEY